jgi:uncharacterized protein DUF5648
MRTLLSLVLLLPLGAPAAQRPSSPTPRSQNEPVPVYRYFHPESRDHLLTVDPDLEASVVAREYTYEGVAFQVFPRRERGMIPLYRFFKPSGGHFYATSREAGARIDARLELTVGYIAEDDRPGLRPLHAWYHASADRHFYTTDREGEFAPRAGYHYQGVLGYVVPARRGL